MKNLCFVCFSMLILLSCQQTASKTADTDAANSLLADQETAEQLAAFYTGNVPCDNCVGIETLLTLNADEARTFSMEEQYLGEVPNTVVSTGTWTVAEDIVTLHTETSVRKYEITDEGLVSLNADGSKRDAASAENYLLTKVLGE